MESKRDIAQKIETAAKKWQAELTLAQYARDHLSEIDCGKTKIANVLDSLYEIALEGIREDTRIDAAEKLLKIASADQRPAVQLNQQFNFAHDEFVLKNHK